MPKGDFSIARIEQTRGSEMAACVEKLRAAMMGAVSEQDVIEIVKRQVQRAKEGDPHALKFVMEYVLGGRQGVQQLTQQIVVNIRKRTKARPGSLGKVPQRSWTGRQPADNP
jgi:hypothetical protein